MNAQVKYLIASEVWHSGVSRSRKTGSITFRLCLQLCPRPQDITASMIAMKPWSIFSLFSHLGGSLGVASLLSSRAMAMASILPKTRSIGDSK